MKHEKINIFKPGTGPRRNKRERLRRLNVAVRKAMWIREQIKKDALDGIQI